MCFIFGVFGIKAGATKLRKKAFELSRPVRHRGPDWFGIYAGDNTILAHERLSIVDADAGVQPLYNQQKIHVLTVNGEIYNHQVLHAEYGDRYQSQTGSDCEVILALYQEGRPEFLDNLQDIFASALYDSKKDVYLIGCDHLGVIPLHMGYGEHGRLYVASEARALVPVCRTIKESPAGSYLRNQGSEIRSYCHRDWFDYDVVEDNVTDKNELRQALEDSVKSYLMSDVPYGVLLSGGLDSSIISAITRRYTARYVEDQECSGAWWPQLHSFTVGSPGSPDLRAAREMTSHLGTVHHEIHFTAQEGLDVIRDMIYHIETYNVTTIRASTPMYLISRKTEAMSIKMVLSNEDSDEVSGGYPYSRKVPNAKELHEETVRKLLAPHMYDCARANETMSAWGVEARVSLLGKEFLGVTMRTNPQDKMHGNGKMEKHILHECFEMYLPVSVARRRKEQFFDGVSYSWIDTLKEVTAQQVSDQQPETARFRFPLDTPTSKEAYLYRETFEGLLPFSSAAECVPGGPSIACSSAKMIEWDEAFRKMDDPSSRTVGVHRSACK